MQNLKKTISKMVAILMAAATIASTGIISAGAYYTYGSSSTAAASKGGYKFYKYGASKYSYTDLYRTSGKKRFVIAQVIVLKKGNNGYSATDYSDFNDGVMQIGQRKSFGLSQSSSYRRYWHRGVLNNNTSYSSGAYHTFSYNIYF